MTDEKKKNITVKEFKMWLEGVEEMQEAGWTPNNTQWQRIRQKINEIAESASAASTAAPVQPVQPMVQPNPGPVTFAPSSFAPPTAMQPAPMHPGYAQPNMPPPGAPFANGSPNIAVKTPAIDTSDGTYTSSFA